MFAFGWLPRRRSCWSTARATGIASRKQQVSEASACVKHQRVCPQSLTPLSCLPTVMSTQDLKDRAAYFTRVSLFVNAETFNCARLSCGGVIEMCRAVVEGRIRNGFAVVRPPGHHSEPEDPSGFCVFNNAAVSAKWLRTIYPQKIRRILLIDW